MRLLVPHMLNSIKAKEKGYGATGPHIPCKVVRKRIALPGLYIGATVTEGGLRPECCIGPILLNVTYTPSYVKILPSFQPLRHEHATLPVELFFLNRFIRDQ